MQRSTLGALLLAVLFAVAAAVAYYAIPLLDKSKQIATSDSARSKGTITVGVDNFVGYYPLCSQYMRQLMLADGWKLDCNDDQADYAGRFEKLRRGELDFAVATVDSYVLGGQRTNYPAVIVSIIDESKGADALLAKQDVVANLTALRSKLDLKVAYTPDSPSHYLLKAVGVHFDVPLFRSQEKGWRIETKGSSEACKKLLSGEAQVAVCWEPDVSSTLAKGGIVKLLGSEQTSRYIVDILLANRDYHDRHPERVKLLLGNYFKALKYYHDNPDTFRKEVASYSRVSESIAESMIKGVSWVNLYDNALTWLGVSMPGQAPQHGLFETIDSTVRILKEFGDISGNPLPGGDPRRIINSSQAALLFSEGVQPGFGTDSTLAGQVQNSLETKFPQLDAAAWDRLREVGTLKVRPILFQSGANALGLDDKRQLDDVAETLKSYPNFRIEVQGHTKPDGDEEANRALSTDRADTVARYLAVTYTIDPNRIRVVGFGSSKPLPQMPGEAYRAYRDRLARVEIHLKAELY